MELDAWTIFAVGGVASLLIERFFYYKSRYKTKKNDKSDDNPGYGERIGKLETAQEQCEKDNEKDHRLIRADIKRLFELVDRKK